MSLAEETNRLHVKNTLLVLTFRYGKVERIRWQLI